MKKGFRPLELRSFFVCIFFLILIVSQSWLAKSQVIGKVYESPNMNKLVMKQEKFAVLPFEFEITENKKKVGMTVEEKVDAESSGSEAAQSGFYTYALRRKQDNGLKVEMQDVKRTNVLLFQAGINSQNTDQFLVEDICAALGVDAIITGEIHTILKQSSGGAVASALLLGYGNTGNATGTIRVYDKSGEMIWSYQKQVTAGIGDVNNLINKLMRKSANRFPYFIR